MKAKLLIPKFVLSSGTSSGVFDTAYLGSCGQLVKRGKLVSFEGMQRISEMSLSPSSSVLKVIQIKLSRKCRVA